MARPIRRIGRAGAFVDDVGFALLFPTAAAALPWLMVLRGGQPAALPLSEMVWGPDAQRRRLAARGAGTDRAPWTLAARPTRWQVGGGSGVVSWTACWWPPAGELASAFGWPCAAAGAAAGAALEELVERGEAVGEAGAWRPARSVAQAEDHARRVVDELEDRVLVA